jgi:hypothetical protein
MNENLVALKLCRAKNATLCPILVLTTRFFGITQSLTTGKTGSLIRPLMSISRDDVKKLCRFWELPIYPDVTNQKIAFTRNRIRKQVFPALRLALNPQIDNVLSQSAEILLADRLHGDLLASKLSRASQPIAALGGSRPAQAGGSPTKCQADVLLIRRIGIGVKVPCYGLPLAFNGYLAHSAPRRWDCIALQCVHPSSRTPNSSDGTPNPSLHPMHPIGMQGMHGTPNPCEACEACPLVGRGWPANPCEAGEACEACPREALGCKTFSPQTRFAERLGPREGYPPKACYALTFEPPNGRTLGGGSCPPVACGCQAAWLRLPGVSEFEMIETNCHGQKRCARLLFQQSTCLFLPQVGGVFVNSAPSLTRKVY